MRIIAGKWRGRRLLPLKGERIRPTTDKVKEAMFSILGPQISGATVLDLCCGTGGLGLEALSRGAQRVYFVDDSHRSLTQVRRNLDLFGALDGEAVLCKAEAVTWFLEWAEPPAGGNWLLVSDPPYSTDVAGEILVQLVDRAVNEGFLGAIVEHDRHDQPVVARENGPRIECRHYGGCGLTIVRPD
ncbi:MAG: 16S rRNA (guanine(966)-N(2))-methyltransferase RsmD [Gemmatimonadales bacterium]|nr:16S rRNA (guanine(966)-N(2))-methyltransferase RsmD [Gemmatimonadales bacterium]